MTHDSLRWQSQLQYAAITDVGMRRTSNQDAHAVKLSADEEAWQKRGHLFLVADGMGAHAAGELASQLAADSVPHLYHKLRDLSGPEALKRAVIDTNAEIHRKGQANLDFHNMGTTCSVLTLLPQGAIVAQVGDSRVYRLRQGLLEQLTFDHSLVWEMRAAGKAGGDPNAEINIPRNVITRSLGPYPDVKVDIEGPFPIQPGDTFMLCSDGLVGEVADDEIGPILATLNPEEAARALVDLANLRGGSDNTTVIVVRVTGDLGSGSSGTAPLTVGSRPQRSSAKATIAWAIFTACLLATGLMALLQSWAAAIGFGIGSIIALVVAGVTQFGGDFQGTIVSGGRRFGKGPYTRTPVEPSKLLVDKLQAMIDELRMADEENSWGLVYNGVEGWLNESDQATAAGEYTKATRLRVRALCNLMEQLRGKGGVR